MIPANSFTSSPQVGNYSSPVNGVYYPLMQTTLGGIAIGDNSKNRQYRRWICEYTGGNITVRPEGQAVVFTLAQTNVLSVSLAFDNAMNIALAWMTPTGAKFYYYDTVSLTNIIVDYPDITSCRVCVDNANDYYNASSDVLFVYTKNNNLYYRQQRDRYDTERLIGSTTKLIKRVGMSDLNRLQIQLTTLAVNLDP
jgi:hypothetical protein